MKKLSAALVLLSCDCADKTARHTSSPFDGTGVAERVLSATVKVKVGDRGHGSGFFCFRPDLVCTAMHVAEDYTELSVVTRSGEKCTVQHVRANPTHDVAVLKVDCYEPGFLDKTVLPVEGLPVMAAGHPRISDYAVSFGHIMNLHNSLGGEDMFMFSAPVNPGNSGGPVVDMHGCLIGVVSRIHTTSGMWAGMGFAVYAEHLEGLAR